MSYFSKALICSYGACLSYIFTISAVMIVNTISVLLTFIFVHSEAIKSSLLLLFWYHALKVALIVDFLDGVPFNHLASWIIGHVSAASAESLSIYNRKVCICKASYIISITTRVDQHAIFFSFRYLFGLCHFLLSKAVEKSSWLCWLSREIYC